MTAGVKIERRPYGYARIALLLFALVSLLLAAGCGGHIQSAHAEPAVADVAASQCHDDHGTGGHEAGPHEVAAVAASAKRIPVPDEVTSLPAGLVVDRPEFDRGVHSGLTLSADPPRKPAGRHYLLLAQIART